MTIIYLLYLVMFDSYDLLRIRMTYVTDSLAEVESIFKSLNRKLVLPLLQQSKEVGNESRYVDYFCYCHFPLNHVAATGI